MFFGKQYLLSGQRPIIVFLSVLKPLLFVEFLGSVDLSVFT